MSKLADKATEQLADHLEPGEQVLAATKAHLEGGTMKLATGFALTGLLEGGDAELGRGAILVATDRRLLVMSATAATFQPDRLVAPVPFASLARVESGTKRVMLVKMTTITLTLHQGPAVTFEVPRVNAKDAEAVVAAIHRGGVA